MKSFLLIAVIVGFAAGDVSHLPGQSGYHYKVPETSYGVPSYQVNTPSYSSTYKGYQQTQEGAGQGYQHAQGANHGYQQAQQANGFGQQGASQGHQTGSQYQSGSNSGYHNANQYQSSGHSVAQAPAANQYLGVQQGNQYQSGSQYESSLVQKYQEFYRQQQQQQTPQVYKHFYVHAAPEEPEAPRFRQPVALPPPQKHYKIIFIKTPAQQSAEPRVVPIHQQNEEKTIVYVLVPKPEEARNVVVPQIEQKPPAKPDVFFIKYHGKKGSQAVINDIVNDYNKEDGASVQYTGLDNGSSGGSLQYTGLENSGASGGSVQYTGLENTGASSGSVQYTGLENAGASTGSVQYTGLENSGVSSVSDSSSAFAQSVVGQVGEDEHSHNVHQSDHQVPQYFGSEGIKTASAEAGYQGVAESSAISHGGSVSSEALNQERITNTVSTSQSVPHESYGIPKFRAN